MDSNFCSGTSWTSNRITSRYSFRSETETLDCQLDRLNQTLLGVLKQDENFLTDSFSFRCNDPLDSEESFIERFEGVLLKYDRSLMMCEDFRSLEMRESEKSPKKISLKDLHKFKNEIENSIDKIENDLEQKLILQSPLGDFSWTIVKEDFLPFKTQVAESFQKNWKKKMKKNLSLKIEENDELNKLMLKSFNETIELPSQSIEFIIPKDLHSQISLEIEYKTLKNSNHINSQTIKNLEWEIVQTKMLKSNLEHKQKLLNEKEASITKQVRDIQVEVQKKQKIMETEKTKTAEILEKVKKQQKMIFDTLNDLQKPIKPPKIQTEFQVLSNKSNFCSPNSEPIQKNEEIVLIDQEISLLEKQLPDSLDKNALVFKINHLKTKLSTMRSTQALNGQIQARRSSGLCRLRVNTPRIEGKLDLSGINLTPRDQLIGFRHSGQDSSRLLTERNSENGENKAEKEENWAKLLELKESRLRKKEQELFARETQLQNSFKAMPGVNKTLSGLKESMSYWKNKNFELEKRENELDKVFKENLELKELIKANNLTVGQLKLDLKEKAENLNKVLAVLKEFKAVDM